VHSQTANNYATYFGRILPALQAPKPCDHAAFSRSIQDAPASVVTSVDLGVLSAPLTIAYCDPSRAASNDGTASEVLTVYRIPSSESCDGKFSTDDKTGEIKMSDFNADTEWGKIPGLLAKLWTQAELAKGNNKKIVDAFTKDHLARPAGLRVLVLNLADSPFKLPQGKSLAKFCVVLSDSKQSKSAPLAIKIQK